MLHKKDYTAIAMILNKAYRSELDQNLQTNIEGIIDLIANGLSDYFTTDNPNFNKDKFIKAILK